MLPLSQMSRGVAVCRQVEGDNEQATRLRRLGICEGCALEVIQAGDPMILRVIGASIGISRQLANLVFVESPSPDRPAVPPPATNDLVTAKQ